MTEWLVCLLTKERPRQTLGYGKIASYRYGRRRVLRAHTGDADILFEEIVEQGWVIEKTVVLPAEQILIAVVYSPALKVIEYLWVQQFIKLDAKIGKLLYNAAIKAHLIFPDRRDIFDWKGVPFLRLQLLFYGFQGMVLSSQIVKGAANLFKGVFHRGKDS